MTDYVRAAILARHDFYVSEVKGRVLSAFSDIEVEAERYTEAEYERLSRVVDPERWDSADVAETARDRGIEPPRVSRRLQLLSRMEPDEQDNEQVCA